MATRLGFEPATFRMQGTEPTTKPPHPLHTHTHTPTHTYIYDMSLTSTLLMNCSGEMLNWWCLYQWVLCHFSFPLMNVASLKLKSLKYPPFLYADGDIRLIMMQQNASCSG